MEAKTVLYGADVGNYIYVENRGVCKVIKRDSQRGRGGWVKMKVLFGDRSTAEYATTASHLIPAIRQPATSEIRDFQTKYEFPGFGKPAEAAQPPPPPPRREAPHIVYQMSGSLKISTEQMVFFKYADLPRFPCSQADLKKGYARVCHEFHPDKGGHASSAAFTEMTKVYEYLKGFCSP
jgi:hypothetical protein